MKTPLRSAGLVSALLASSLMVGCGEKKQTPPPTAQQKADAMNNAISNNTSGNPLSAPADYLGAAVKAQQQAINTIDTSAINNAIQQFLAAEGRYPKDLNELVQTHYLSKIPPAPNGMKIEYDPNAGQAKVVRQ